jgi:uncharacterized protein YlbG (UPF0298 family)
MSTELLEAIEPNKIISNEYYLDVALVISKIESLPKEFGSINNIKSSFNQMINKQLINPCQLILDLGINFKLTRSNVKVHVNKTRKNKQWPSHLNDIRTAYILVKNEKIKTTHDLTFQDTFIYFLQKFYGQSKSIKFFCKILANDLNLGSSSLEQWLYKGTAPTQTKSINAVEKIDDYLNAKGALIAKCQLPGIEGSRPIKKISEDIDDLQLLKNKPLSDSLMNEINQYINWKKNRVTPVKKSNLVSGIKDRLKRFSNSEISDKKWSINNSGHCSGENNFLKIALRYFNVLSHELNVDSSEFVFSDFFNFDYISVFINYCTNRGIIPSCLGTIRYILSETKKCSYTSIYISDEESKDHDEWVSYLELIHSVYKNKYKELDDEYEKLEGARNVQFILDSENPFHTVNKITHGLYHGSKTIPTIKTRISSYRWALTYELSLVSPIRIENLNRLEHLGSYSENIALTKFKNEKSIGVYFNENHSCYGLFVHKSYLKNRRSKNINDIHILIPHLTEKINSLIDLQKEFFTQFPELRVNRVLGFKTTNSHKKNPYMSNSSFSTSYKTATKKVINAYFPNVESDGINPHGMRHLVASLYLIDNPENFLGLATLLMDELQTVMDNYAHRNDNLYAKKITLWASNRFGATHA